MRNYWSLLPKRRIVANYIGGLGYYGWYFAVFLLAAQVAVQAAQFLVAPSQPIYDTPVPSGTPAEVATAGGAGIFVDFASLVLIALAFFAVLATPYYIAWLSRGLPRTIVSHTSKPLTLQTLHAVKQIACIVVIVTGTLLLFAPYQSGLVNALYMTILVVLAFSMLCFWVQQKIVTLWHIPERHVY